MTVDSIPRYEPLARDLLRHDGHSIRLAGAQKQVAKDLTEQRFAGDSEQEALMEEAVRWRVCAHGKR